jgi:hypothetical protein
VRLAEIQASPEKPVYVNLVPPGYSRGILSSNHKWDGKRLWSATHDFYFTRHGWSRKVDVSLEEMNSNRWQVYDHGPIDLSEGEF